LLSVKRDVRVCAVGETEETTTTDDGNTDATFTNCKDPYVPFHKKQRTSLTSLTSL